MKPNKESVQQALPFLSYLADKATDETIAFTALVFDSGYEKGREKGYEDGKSEGYDEAITDMNESDEKVGVRYVVEAFEDVTTFDEFKAKYLEMVRIKPKLYSPNWSHIIFRKQLTQPI